MNQLRRLIENTEQLPDLARGLLRAAASGTEHLAAFATSEGYPMSAEDIVTTLYGAAQEGGSRGVRRETMLGAAEDDATRRAWRMPFAVRNPMLDLFRWYRETVA